MEETQIYAKKNYQQQSWAKDANLEPNIEIDGIRIPTN